MANPIYIHKKQGVWKASALRALLDAAPDGQYAVTFKRHSGRKSTSQNSYLHVLFTIVADTLNSEGMGDGTRMLPHRNGAAEGGGCGSDQADARPDQRGRHDYD
jgi:hypothetical protein